MKTTYTIVITVLSIIATILSPDQIKEYVMFGLLVMMVSINRWETDKILKATKPKTESKSEVLNIPRVSTRYFVVGYVGTMHTGQLTGSINMWSESGYLTRARATQVIEEHNQGIKDVVITNVTELNKEDFEAWRANVC